jgi:ethanolamine utilization protein EutN
MRLGVVVGQVVSTVKHAALTRERLLLVKMIDASGEPSGEMHVAADSIGGGNGEWVLLVSGSSARESTNDGAPVDLCVVGIIDEVVLDGAVAYHK